MRVQGVKVASLTCSQQAAIAKLKQLRSLLATWNNLVMLPPEIGQLARLEKLDVGFNKVRRLELHAAVACSHARMSNLV